MKAYCKKVSRTLIFGLVILAIAGLIHLIRPILMRWVETNDYWKYILFGQWKYILWISLFFLVSDYFGKIQELKEERKENYDLQDENYNLKKKIDDLEEDNKFLKEIVMEFKGGELTKGELIKHAQALIDKEEVERLERLQKAIQEEKELFEK